jgi:hypothetical protein
MSKKIQINADTTFKYLQIFNGILELTDKELLILSKFIDLSDTSNLCSAKTKKKVAEEVGIADPNTLNNYVKRLKDKGAILKNKNGYIVSQLLRKEKRVIIEITT